jgi:hypothetical protein
MWVPQVIHEDYIKYVMNQWGELQDIRRSTNFRGQLTYIATLAMSRKQRDELPHSTEIQATRDDEWQTADVFILLGARTCS